MPDAQFYLREEPVCALDPLLLIPRIEYAEPIFTWSQSQGIPYSLVILDMKNFHVTNDLCGYEAGDRILAEFIGLVRSQLPPGSKAMRFRHGDEFLFFVPKYTVPGSLFKEIRKRCDGSEYPQFEITAGPPVTFRFAVVELDRTDLDYKEWMRVAEKSLREVRKRETLDEIDKGFGQLTVERRAALYYQFEKTKEQMPHNHSLALVIGRIGATARNILQSQSRDVVSAIDRSMKKNEVAYWMSASEIGIFIYQGKGTSNASFIENVLRMKLATELGAKAADAFLEDTQFAMIAIDDKDDLEKAELHARNALENTTSG